MVISAQSVTNAYLYLKNYAYHENLNLFLKQRIADFECSIFGIEDQLSNLTEIINTPNVHETPEFNEWLSQIDYHLMPKTISNSDRNGTSGKKNQGTFISNITNSDEYAVSNVNYLIDAPIELHIIETLWSLIVGPVLEKKLTKDCYGNRLNDYSLKFLQNEGNVSNKSTEIFKRYIEQYNAWRDQAIDTATEVSKKDEDVALLSLDLKSFFYHIHFDFSEIKQEIDASFEIHSLENTLASNLNSLLHKIYFSYRGKIDNSIALTHEKSTEKLCLPIGFSSASIIANWYLSDFDFKIINEVRPAYYGRYVDDIIMVFKSPKYDMVDPLNSFVKQYLDDVLLQHEGSNEYYISKANNSLPVQKDKLILQHFDKEHSRAVLDVFKQELEDRSSAFRFLPSDHLDKDLDKFAYDVLYDGSVNKFRSIVGLAENETELSKYLSSHIIAHRLCKKDKKDKVLPELKLFFQGRCALQFSRLWEKVYQYALITKDYAFIKIFFEYLNKEIKKISSVSSVIDKIDTEILAKLKSSLQRFNAVSLSLTFSLLDIRTSFEPLVEQDRSNGIFYNTKNTRLAKFLESYGLHNLARNFRKSNMLRHNLVAWPLANYSSYNGDLTDDQSFVKIADLGLLDLRLMYSPRFIHYDEWQVFHLPKSFNNENGIGSSQQDTHETYIGRYFNGELPIEFISRNCTDGDNTQPPNVTITDVKIKGNDTKNIITVALANIKIPDSDIEAGIRKDQSPNVSFERQKNLYQVLNTTVQESADILVIPEMAIPVSWLPFMIAHARRHQIGIIFGLEHWVVDGYAYNLIIEALPFKVNDKYNSCVMTARVKNHYAPAEVDLIARSHFVPANLKLKPNNYYHKVSWKGISFATYNCFELSDIVHRTLFKSEIDVLFACVWNKDINYYQSILDSSVRDIHCYVVQSNTSQYGGSCVLQPTRTEIKTKLFVKGGTNASVLTTEIDIAGLRKFQYQSKPKHGDIYKPLPPGFDCEAVLKR